MEENLAGGEDVRPVGVSRKRAALGRHRAPSRAEAVLLRGAAGGGVSAGAVLYGARGVLPWLLA